MVTAVLGIDAAWTPGNPSGVALIAKQDDRWKLVALTGSYSDFLDLAGVPGEGVAGVPAAAVVLAGRALDLVAVDMPIALDPQYRSTRPTTPCRGCGAHGNAPPSNTQRIASGAVGERLHRAFEAAGYSLATTRIGPRSLIEIYPHPAMVELLGAAERVPYKAGKVRAYWPSLTPIERRGRLLSIWSEAVQELDRQIEGVGEALPHLPESARGGPEGVRGPAGRGHMRVGWCLALDGNAVPHGDD